MNNSDFIMHYGIPGQKWGVRRYQNEDGTLTEEGKARYYDSLNANQKQEYDKLSERNRKFVNDQMSKGKTYDEASRDLKRTQVRKAVALASLAVSAISLYRDVKYRTSVAQVKNSASRVLYNRVVNSNAFQRGSQYVNQFMKRRKAVRNGAIILKKGQYSVKDAVSNYGNNLTSGVRRLTEGVRRLPG